MCFLLIQQFATLPSEGQFVEGMKLDSYCVAHWIFLLFNHDLVIGKSDAKARIQLTIILYSLDRILVSALRTVVNVLGVLHFPLL